MLSDLGPLHIAAYSCNSNNEEKKKKIFKLLLDAGIENDIKNDNGYTLIDILANQRLYLWVYLYGNVWIFVV